jgi:hypothetical protein
MVNKAFREACREPSLWRELAFERQRKLTAPEHTLRKALGYPRYTGGVAEVTDERLASLVRRSRSSDGKLSLLDSLDVRQLRLVTALADHADDEEAVGAGGKRTGRLAFGSAPSHLSSSSGAGRHSFFRSRKLARVAKW